ncbi:uncharacterized protein TNIN_429141 [Trichonephila inaurata madagascariensis]|uniref:Uncharacterized protein n=1 Tax=Trichonephila inaurata madagascariensis TaxID=2747483 RepID=A0A8X6YJU4_9ARAC|nr:uncharacterized protein TNIN_429141 [Trichonephila inaurata madagascariensis]
MNVLTLQQMATVKIATYFFRAHEISDIEEKYQTHLYVLPDKKWEHVIKQKLPPPCCSTALLNEITAAVRALSFEVWHWRVDHFQIFKKREERRRLFNLPLSWKSDGTIDRIRTAGILIQSQFIDLETRFTLACNYWSWHKILEFSKTIPDDEYQVLVLKYHTFSTATDVQMVSRWFNFIMKRNVSHSCQLWSLEFKWTSVTMFNHVFNHLPIEKRLALETSSVRSSHISLGRYCLMRMNVQRRLQMLQQYPYQVLRILLHWPLQSFFKDYAAVVRETLPNRSFLQLIHIIICQKILPGFREFNYVDLLRTFWRDSPIRCKDYVRGDAIFEILTVILEGRGFRTHLRSGIPRRYLVHGGNVIGNTCRCIKLIMHTRN